MTDSIPTVRVYTKPNCKQCDLTKAKLDAEDIPYEVADLTIPENLEAAKALGFMSAPVVMVGEDGWAGFRPDKLNELATRFEDAR
jgi:glutaredoxin-like protein NrdH